MKANALHLFDLIRGLGPGRDRSELLDLIKPMFEGLVFGEREAVLASWPPEALHLRDSTVINCVIPRHVVPVYVEHGAGCMVPMTCTHADQWDASDACTRLSSEGTTDPVSGLNSILERIESAWQEAAGTKLPLRWRRAYSIGIPIGVHIGDVAGDSLQLPIALMLIREAASEDGELPFGGGPVFSTGRINEAGAILDASRLNEKLAGFRREYQTGRFAVLSEDQEARIDPRLLDGLTVHRANDLPSLLKIGAIRQGLERLAGPPRRTEMDHLVRLMIGLERGIRFADALSLSEYLLQHATTDPYRTRVLTATAHLLLHEGRVEEAGQKLDEAKNVMNSAAGDLGADVQVHYSVIRAVHLLDTGKPQQAIAALEEFSALLKHCSHLRRIEVRGTRSQAYRATGDHGRALREGRLAVRLAQRGLASEAGRDLNYVAHALIRAVEQRPGRPRRRLLERAQTILDESRETWAPVEPMRKEVHAVFCRHYQAEIDRLWGRGSTPGARPAGLRADWRYPWLFTLLSCSRNPANELASRIAWAQDLVTESGSISGNGKPTPRIVFKLAHLVYQIWAAALQRADFGHVCLLRDQLTNWLDEQALDGWRALLSANLHDVPNTPEARIEWADRLCSAIYFH